MDDVRVCAQCGSLFGPRREHARFCSASCRMVWDRDQLGDPAPGLDALGWSAAAMREAAGLLAGTGTRDRQRAFDLIGELVWWVTMVDATLVRHHPDAYDTVLAGKSQGDRRRIEGVLGGLRFVRNYMGGGTGCADLIDRARPQQGPVVSCWGWRLVPEPRTGAPSSRGLEWELRRHRSYQAFLAGRVIGESFSVAAAFLGLTVEAASAAADGTSRAR